MGEGLRGIGGYLFGTELELSGSEKKKKKPWLLVKGETLYKNTNFDILYSHLRYFIRCKRFSGYLWDFLEDSHTDGESFFSTSVFWLLLFFTYIALVSILRATLNSSLMLLVCFTFK